MRLDRALLFLFLSLSCARTRPDGYLLAHAAAERAYAHGRYLEAAEHWERAALSADDDKDRGEARYRRAVSLKRAGKVDDAARALDELSARSSTSERAARALFDRALIDLERGAAETAQNRLDELLRRYPSSGLAPRALRLRLRHIENADGDSLRYLDGLLKAQAGTELEQHVRYAAARRVEETGRLQEARSRYARLAELFPYPRGAYWDDALWHLADLEARLGRPEHAIEVLRRMLDRREQSHGIGSYERSRYAEARYRIAELYRDALGDAKRSRQEFRRLWTEHPTSRLRDDAKWQEARLAHASGDREGACRALEDLAGDLPDSRYTPCAPHLCARLQPPKGRRCHAYVVRDLEVRPRR